MQEFIKRYFKENERKIILGKDTLIQLQESIRNYTYIAFADNIRQDKQQRLIVEYTSRDQIAKSIESFLREHLKSHIEKKVNEYSKNIDKDFNQIRVKNMRSRWGSCSSRGNLNFSIYLIFNPIESIDYVIAHELCHLIEMNHSKRFWKLVESIRPNYKQERKNLKMPEQITKNRTGLSITALMKKKAPQKLLWRLFKV